MAFTVDHPRTSSGWHRAPAIRARIYHPSAVVLMAVLAVLLGAWAAMVAFVGPAFDYDATGATTWQWTRTNWLLHLLPGAVVVLAGLIVIMLARAAGPGSRGMIRLCSFAMIAAGAWLVVGPALAPMFKWGQPYGPASDATTSFTYQIGANLGPGLLIVALGAMILESVSGMHRVHAATTADRAPEAELPLDDRMGTAATGGGSAATVAPRRVAEAPVETRGAATATPDPVDEAPATPVAEPDSAPVAERRGEPADRDVPMQTQQLEPAVTRRGEPTGQPISESVDPGVSRPESET